MWQVCVREPGDAHVSRALPKHLPGFGLGGGSEQEDLCGGTSHDPGKARSNTLDIFMSFCEQM